jgi:hypothetical protein
MRPCRTRFETPIHHKPIGMVIGALTGQHEGAAVNIGSTTSQSEGSAPDPDALPKIWMR